MPGPVALYLGSTLVGTSQAGSDGRFSARLDLPDLSVGRYEIDARCGPTIVTPIDIIQATAVSGASSSIVVYLFLLLLGVYSLTRFRGR